MDAAAIMNTLGLLIDDAKAGVLATVDAAGRPHMRWMTPAILRDRPRDLFCVACPGTQKVKDLTQSPFVEWVIQNRALTEVITIRGKVNIVDNAAIKNEIMEAIGHRLEVFWRANCGKRDFIVLETIITEAVYLKPMQGLKETVRF
jgi:general stress protein 26